MWGKSPIKSQSQIYFVKGKGAISEGAETNAVFN